MSDFWVFGYGSLMWRTGFDVLEQRQALMRGVHRSLCIYSWVHRGTQERPGLVLGLDKGGSCQGMAFKVAGHKRTEVIEYLRARELVTNVYVETERHAILDTGERVPTVTYVVDPKHQQYAGKLSVDQVIQQVCGAVGQSGPNEEYVLNTAEHLETLGINDQFLQTIAGHLRS